MTFLSTLSLRRATRIDKDGHPALYISIHALLAESDARNCAGIAHTRISIHALLAESDALCPTWTLRRAISIHALLAESDGSTAAVVVVVWVFLSTLSLRRATAPDNLSEYDIMHFYPRSPCGERPCLPSGSIVWNLVFLSTLSLRRATYGFKVFPSVR